MDEPVGAAGAAGRRAGLQRRARRRRRPTGGQRPSHPGQRRGRLFPYGRHHRRAQAGHPHARQPVFPPACAVQLQNAGPGDVVINGYPLFHVAGALPASLAALSAGVATIIPTTQLLRNREVLRNYWRLVERHRATRCRACRPSWRRWPRCRWTARTFLLRYCRTGACRCRPNWPRASERQFGLHVNESLGMTEMAGISSISPPGWLFRSTAGSRCPMYRCASPR